MKLCESEAHNKSLDVVIGTLVDYSKSQTWNHDVKVYQVDWDNAIVFYIIGMLKHKNTFKRKPVRKKTNIGTLSIKQTP